MRGFSSIQRGFITKVTKTLTTEDTKTQRGSDVDGALLRDSSYRPSCRRERESPLLYTPPRQHDERGRQHHARVGEDVADTCVHSLGIQEPRLSYRQRA